MILLEGQANLLKERSKLTDNPLFRALLVLDVRAGNLTAGLDARYRFGSGGELIDISGSAEAYFDFVDASPVARLPRHQGPEGEAHPGAGAEPVRGRRVPDGR